MSTINTITDIKYILGENQALMKDIGVKSLSHIDDYIENQKSPQKEILQKVRKIFQKTLPGCEEKTAWGAITFALGKFYIGAMQNRVHVGFVITGLSKEEISLFEGSGKTMRHIKIHTLDDIDEKTLIKLIKIVDKKAICKPY